MREKKKTIKRCLSMSYALSLPASLLGNNVLHGISKQGCVFRAEERGRRDVGIREWGGGPRKGVGRSRGEHGMGRRGRAGVRGSGRWKLKEEVERDGMGKKKGGI